MEQDIQLIRGYLPRDPITAQNLATSMKVDLDRRIIELLEAEQAKEREQ